MNELLGWYGYTDVIKSQDTAQLSLSTFQPPTASSPRQRAAGRHVDTPEAEAEDEDDNHIHDDNDDPELGAPRPDSAGSARMPRDEENDTGRLSEYRPRYRKEGGKNEEEQESVYIEKMFEY
ncbi:hypothetical protein C0Q70_10847 [Pomacea canaliculata]|uniref:Uncharacterized protein n=1 Tax=Pomacea canaliculata TaxID=400727 RepID=A0A2T7P4C5_POMCA|nr:hypothetical protein C0Q70_10847 [Pomacea canaliculata]